jgi:PAS domain S-box-containing protein
MPLRFTRVRTQFVFLLVLWSGAIIVLFFGNSWHHAATIRDIAAAEAHANLNKDLSTLMWAAQQGGLYVPVSPALQPDPCLKQLPERDIRTSDGRHLTLIDPVFLHRQMTVAYGQAYGVQSRLVSIDPSRSETGPDGWEAAALRRLNHEAREVVAFCDIGGAPHLRAMMPLFLKSECMQCHAGQGDKMGDLRGGLSLTLPMAPYLDHLRQDTLRRGVSMGVLWLLGGVGIGFASYKLSRVIQRHEYTEKRLRASRKNNQALIDNSLTGICIVQDDAIIFCNTPFARIHGYAPEEVMGMAPIDLVHAQDRDRVRDLDRKMARGEAVAQVYETRCISRDGRTIWVQRRNTLIRRDGRMAMLGSEIDITARKQAEDELKASEAQLKRLVTRLLRYQEAERKTLALQIHEEIAQSLSAIKWRLENYLEGQPAAGSTAADVMPPIIDRLKENIELIRRMTRKLSPIMLDSLGVKSAVEGLCQDFASGNRLLKIETRIDVEEAHIPDDLKIVLYRVIEEVLALSATRKHRQACIIGLSEAQGRIELSVQGRTCFDTAPSQSRERDLKLAMIRNRVESAGGTLIIDPSAVDQPAIVARWPRSKPAR